MKSFYKIIAVFMSMLATSYMVGCSDEENKTTAEGPDLYVEISQTTANSIEAEFRVVNAETSYIMCAETPSNVDLNYVIQNGIPMQETSFNYTFTDLKSSTSYAIYIAAKNSSGQKMLRVEGQTLGQEEPFDGYELNTLVAAFYTTANVAAAGNYEITFGNAEQLEWEGDINVTLSLFNLPDEDSLNATVPSGLYTPNSDYSAFSYSPSLSYVDIVAEGPEVVTSPLFGTVTVEREGPTYTITVEGTLMLLNDMEFKARYVGPIQFVESGSAAYTRFNTDQNVTFTKAEGRYWGNWYRPHADDLYVDFFDGEFNEDGKLVKGYQLSLKNIYMTKYADYNADFIPIAEGTYKVNRKRMSDYTRTIPFTIDPGSLEPVFEELMLLGTNLTYVDEENNIKIAGIVAGGEMELSRNGEEYQIRFDFVSEEGVKLTGTYEGKINLGNYNDNDTAMEPRPWSTLTEDHVYNIPQGAYGYAYLYGSYLYPNLDSWFIMVYATNDEYPAGYGDMFTTELLINPENGTEFPVGTFNIGMQAEPYTMFCGTRDFSRNILYTHYGDLTPDAEGYSSQVAPISSGTVKISKVEEGIYKFEFDMVDDAGNKITGEWSGPVYTDDFRDELAEEEQSVAAPRLRRR
uniref:hypothetical protein n=1 Tax=Alistipes sp. TaxID=1872444 RepID=UPI0040566DA4